MSSEKVSQANPEISALFDEARQAITTYSSMQNEILAGGEIRKNLKSLALAVHADQLPVLVVCTIVSPNSLHQKAVVYDPSKNELFWQSQQIKDDRGHLLTDKRWVGPTHPFRDNGWAIYGINIIDALEEAVLEKALSLAHVKFTI